MIATRRLSVGETMLASGGVRILAATTVAGPMDDTLLARAVRAQVSKRVLLHTRQFEKERNLHFIIDGHAPDTELHRAESLLDELRIPSVQGGPPSRAALIAEPDGTHTLVLSVDHAVSDGRSVMALLHDIWRHYTALWDGHVETTVAPPAPRLPDSLEARVLRHVAAAYPDGHAPESIPPRVESRGLAPVTVGPGDDASWACGRVELDAPAAVRFVSAARAAGMSVHGLLAGVLLAALRAVLRPATGQLPLSCLSAVDMRRRLDPQLSPSVLLCAASSVVGHVDVSDADSPTRVGARLESQLRVALDTGAVERAIAAIAKDVVDVPAEPVNMIVTNLGRLNDFILPAGVQCTQVRLIPRVPAPMSVAAITHASCGIGIDLPYQRAWFTDTQMDELSGAIRQTLAGSLG